MSKYLSSSFPFFGILFMILFSCESGHKPTPPTPPISETPVETKPITQEDVSFSSLDGIPISATYYKGQEDKPLILLCHQARFSSGEYSEIAPKLQKMGYSSLAINQRSGGPVNGINNSTFEAAKKANLPTKYLDAEQDIQASIEFATKTYKKPIILWGSSYSSTLVLYLAPNSPTVIASVSFSPGNYFSEEKGSLIPILREPKKPFYLTSSKEEAPGTSELVQGVKLDETHVHFIPSKTGKHGSRALWKNHPGNKEYWASLTSYLAALEKKR